MIHAVLDTNVLASGVLRFEREESTPGAILRAWYAEAFVLVTSDHLIAEIERTLAKPYFAQRIPEARRATALTAFVQDAARATITVGVSGVASHPKDDLVLATAVSAGADYLVTGDRKLQALGSYRGVIIVSPRVFLSLLTDAAPSTDRGSTPRS